MIRGLWVVVSTIAIANLLALLGFAGWLATSDRLGPARIEKIRLLLSETQAQERARVEAEQAETDRLAEEAVAQEQRRQPPLTPVEALAVSATQDDLHRQAVDRLRREAQDLQRTLLRERADLDEGWRKLEAERKAFEAMRQEIAALEGSEQFEKTLRLYESVKPKQAKDMMQALIDEGEIEQAVAYLNAMQTRAATKIVAEFKEPAVAKDLLERLRTRGLEARAPEASN